MTGEGPPCRDDDTAGLFRFGPAFFGLREGQLYGWFFRYSVPSFCVRGVLLPPAAGPARPRVPDGWALLKERSPPGRRCSETASGLASEGRHFPKERSAWRKEP